VATAALFLSPLLLFFPPPPFTLLCLGSCSHSLFFHCPCLRGERQAASPSLEQLGETGALPRRRPVWVLKLSGALQVSACPTLQVGASSEYDGWTLTKSSEGQRSTPWVSHSFLDAQKQSMHPVTWPPS